MNHECVEPGPMPFHELKQITNNFSEEQNIGRGAYGSVYMGMYEDGRKVAVKVLHSRPGFDEKQFQTEFHNLKSLKHQNIVCLIGYCHETTGEFLQHNEKTVLASKINMALCMEYMPKGSLDKHIFDEYSGHNWHTRYKIIKGICNGLQYLHEELETPFYHLDLKPDNILLDEEMVPKIGDFGLSRFFADQQTQIASACIGTLGYLPPEYLERKAISNKLDIFSLGVVITKIISGSEGFLFSWWRMFIIWQTIEQTVKIIYHNAGLGEVFSSDVHPTEPWILIGYSGGSIAIWDYKTQARVTALKIAKEDKEPGPFSFVRKKEKRRLRAFTAKFIARKQWLAAGDGFGFIHVHGYTRSGGGAMSMDEVKKFHAHTGAVTTLAVHPSEPFLLSASRDKQIKLWDWANGWRSIRTFKSHKNRVDQVVFNPRNSSTFASVSADCTILIWDISSTVPITKMNLYGTDRGYAVNYFSTSDDCQCLVAVCERGRLSAETCVKSFYGLQTSSLGSSVACCAGVVDSLPDRPMLATASADSAICLYDYMVNSYKRRLYFGLGNVHHIAYIKEINSVAIAFEQGLAIMEMPS